jgi:hypothetical protein
VYSTHKRIGSKPFFNFASKKKHVDIKHQIAIQGFYSIYDSCHKYFFEKHLSIFISEPGLKSGQRDCHVGSFTRSLENKMK